ncbi:aquaporin-8-like isoform X1 [Huso huso]|uniref:Aquaporin-8-like isoform X1 n=1 Tax=Huso huso TaxID=61971 RepID=A0ABR0YV29_HUSHU
MFLVNLLHSSLDSPIFLCNMPDEELELSQTTTTFIEENQKVARTPSRYEEFIQPCVAELIASIIFVFIGSVSVIENVESAGRLQPALVHGLTVAVLVAIFAEVSGGQFNPVLTVAIYLVGGINLMMAIAYIIVQMIGGLIGAALAKMMTSRVNFANASGAAFTVVKSNDQIAGAVFGEIAMTCFVVMVVCMGAVNSKSKTPLVPFCIGCTVIVNVLAGGDVSGTCLNPARAFGPAVMANYWSYHWIYWIGPLAGALLAAGLMRLLLGDEKIRLFMK